MSIFEVIGMAWVIFTSSLASVYLVYAGFKYSKAHHDAAQKWVIQEDRLTIRGYQEEQRDLRIAR